MINFSFYNDEWFPLFISERDKLEIAEQIYAELYYGEQTSYSRRSR